MLLLALASCAVEKSPGGGEKDTTPPEIIAVDPPHRSRYFDSKKITFYFNEFIDPAVSGGDIFISPLLPLDAYEAYVYNRKLHVKFKEELADSTTYIVTLGSKVKDFRGKNKLEKSIQYAFTTGNILDSARVSGTILNARTNAPMTEMNVLLYPADSIVQDSFLSISPTYAAYTEAEGKFTLGFLKLGNYRILGLKDKDGNYKYNLPTEMIALPDTAGIRLSPDSSRAEGVLYAFTPDNRAPGINSVNWLNSRNLKLEFSEEVVRIDSALLDSQNIALTQTPDEPTVWYLHLPAAVQDSAVVDLRGVRDTVTNTMDSLLVVKLRKNAVFDSSFTAQAVKPEGRYNPYAHWFMAKDVLDSTRIRNHLAVVDTGGDTLAAAIQSVGHFIRVQLPDTLKPVKPVLAFDVDLRTPAGLRPDSNYTLAIPPADPAQFGSLSGRFLPADSLDNPILFLELDKDTRFELRPGPFKLKHVPVGTYKMRVLEDRDGNGRWSPGSLQPRKRHESVRLTEQVVDVKSGFLVEGVDVYYPPRPEDLEPSQDATTDAEDATSDGASTDAPDSGGRRPGRK